VSLLGSTAPAVGTLLRIPSPNYLLVGGLGLVMLRLATTRSGSTSAATNPATPAAA
jgi:hypothetical protein